MSTNTEVKTRIKNKPHRLSETNIEENPTFDMKRMEAHINELRNEAKKRKVDANGALDTQLKMAEAQFDLFKAKMREAGRKTGAASTEIKEGVEKAWIDLKSSVERASKYLN